MKIQVKLMGMLKDQTPEGGVIELPAGATIESALVAMDIPVDSVHVFTVNGQLIRDRGHELADGDEFTVVPPVGGG